MPVDMFFLRQVEWEDAKDDSTRPDHVALDSAAGKQMEAFKVRQRCFTLYIQVYTSK